MRKMFAVAVVVGALSVAPALAQTQSGTQSGQDQSPKMATSGNLAATDRTFVKEAASGGLAEVELGNLAKEKASSPEVKQFADRMVTDHSKANDELKQWAQQKSVTLPTAPDAKQKATRDRLAKLSGDAFDKAYMQDMVKDHKQDVAAFRKASQASRDADLKAWAGQTLPTLQDHLKIAQDTAAKVGANTAATSGHKPAHMKHHSKKASKDSGR